MQVNVRQATWKEKYRSTITQNKGKLLPKIEEINIGKAHGKLIEIF